MKKKSVIKLLGLILLILVILLAVIYIRQSRIEANSVVIESEVEIAEILSLKYGAYSEHSSFSSYNSIQDKNTLDDIKKNLNKMAYSEIGPQDERIELDHQYIKYIWQICFVMFTDQNSEEHELFISDFREYNNSFAVVLNNRRKIYWVNEDDEFCNYFINLIRSDYDIE
jgi:hypothetical protein